jgi:hypothetical protein
MRTLLPVFLTFLGIVAMFPLTALAFACFT